MSVETYLEEFYTFESFLIQTYNSYLTKVKDKITQKVYVIKKIIHSETYDENSIILEIEILKMLKGNYHTIQFEANHKDNNIYYIITEYLNSYVTIYEFFKNNISDGYIHVVIFNNLLKGLKSIHDTNIIHRDIKGDNIMINPTTLEIKYIDFGLSDTIETYKYTPIYFGIADYLNVQVFKIKSDDEYTLTIAKNCDLFSLGIMFYHLLTHKTFLQKFIKRMFRFGNTTHVWDELKKDDFYTSHYYHEYLKNFLIYYNTWIDDEKIIRFNESMFFITGKIFNFDNLFIRSIQSEPIYE
jgi:serine/threonine protein kinase